MTEGALGMVAVHRAVVKLDLEHRVGQLLRDDPQRGEHRDAGEPDAYPERGY